MDERLQKLEADIDAIKKRNMRVEGDKAWETSLVRRATIGIITYFFAVFLLYLIGAHNLWTNALVPTFGYILSTLSLPFIRSLWQKQKR